MLHTDHQALTCLLTSKGTGCAGLRIAKCSAKLLCFLYDVAYHPGKLNMTADCLSRLPLPTTCDASEVTEMVAAVFQESLHAVSLPKFAAACDTCPELTQLRCQIQTGWLKCRKNVTSGLVPDFNVKDELVVDNSLIMRGTDCFVVPVSLRPRVIDLAHEGHQGLIQTKQRLSELY